MATFIVKTMDEEAFDADFYCAQFHDHEDSDPPIEEDEP